MHKKKLKKNTFDFLLAFFFITYPFSIKLNSFSIILLSIYSICNVRRIKAYRPPIILWVFLAYFLVLSVSAVFFSKAPGQIESILSFLVFPLIFYVNRPKIKSAKIFVFLIASVVIACLTSLIINIVFFQINEVPFNLYLDWRYNNDFLSQQIGFNANYFTALIAIAIFYIVNQKLFISSSNKNKFGWLVLLIFLMFYLFLLSSRFLLLIIFLTCFWSIIAVLWKGRKKHLFWTFVVFFSTFLLLRKTPVFEQRLKRTLSEMNQVFESNQELNVGGLTVRKEIWGCAIKLIGENPVAGVGLGNEKKLLVECYSHRNFKEGIFYEYDAHNQYLQSFLGTGVLGFLLALLIFFLPFITSVRQPNILFISISLLFLLFAFTEAILEVHKGIVLFCFFALLVSFEK